jgi:hypothetical protein
MARLLTNGFEGNGLISLSIGSQFDGTINNATPTIGTSIVRSGTYALVCDSGAGNTVPQTLHENVTTTAAGTTFYARAYVRLSAAPGTTSSIITFGGTDFLRVQLGTDFTLRLLNKAGTQVGSSSSALSADTWYRVEVGIMSAAGSNDDYLELRLDGVTVASTTTANQGTGGGTLQLILGWQVAPPGANKIVYFDDVAVNDSSGGSQNSWPGDAGVVLLKPISDNARATLWTGGTGGTTNLFDAVNNTPPAGTASESNTTQIEHAGGAAGSTDAYDANMTTYETVGIGPSDTINVIQLLAWHGEDVATGAKLLAFSVVSNPAIASSGNVTAGDTTPDALGTWPTEWGFHRGTHTYGSSVTVGTSPVMRALRPETASRVASVCFMGMYVDYTPRRSPPFRSKMIHNALVR